LPITFIALDDCWRHVGIWLELVCFASYRFVCPRVWVVSHLSWKLLYRTSDSVDFSKKKITAK
jgi:hypothetical protein